MSSESPHPPRVLVFSALVCYGSDDAPPAALVPVKQQSKWPGCHYVLFTTQSNRWLTEERALALGWDSLVRVTPTEKDLSRPAPVLAKRIKWMVWEWYDVTEYDMVVWIDVVQHVVNLDLVPVGAVADRPLPLATQLHPDRRCIYDECQKVMQWGRDVPRRVKLVEADLKAMGMPRHFGLPETAFVAYIPTHPRVRAFNTAVVDRVTTTSYRDQLAFTLVLFRQGMSMADLWLVPHKTAVAKPCFGAPGTTGIRLVYAGKKSWPPLPWRRQPDPKADEGAGTSMGADAGADPSPSSA